MSNDRTTNALFKSKPLPARGRFPEIAPLRFNSSHHNGRKDNNYKARGCMQSYMQESSQCMTRSQYVGKNSSSRPHQSNVPDQRAIRVDKRNKDKNKRKTICEPNVIVEPTLEKFKELTFAEKTLVFEPNYYNPQFRNQKFIHPNPKMFYAPTNFIHKKKQHHRCCCCKST